jgi:hypothetical protein
MVVKKKNQISKKTKPLKKLNSKKADSKKVDSKKVDSKKENLNLSRKKQSTQKLSQTINVQEKNSLSDKIKKVLTFDSYYNLLLFLLFFLVFIIFCNFIIKLAVFSIAPPLVIYYFNFSFSYIMYNILFFLTFFLIYIFFASEAVRINISFKYFSKSMFNLSLFLFFLESLLIIVGFFTFLTNYYLFLNIKSQLYVFYLISWIVIKYLTLLIIAYLSYAIFKIFKQRYLWH